MKNDSDYPKTFYGDEGNSSAKFLTPYKLSTGVLRGSQDVGAGGTKIDSANNRITLGDSIVLDGNNDVITITNPTGAKVGLGLIPGSTTSFGFFVMDANGNVLMKIVDSTLYAYDIANGGVNVMQMLKLPDGTYGWAIAATGKNVSDGIS